MTDLKLIYSNVNRFNNKKITLFNFIQKSNINGAFLVKTKTKLVQTVDIAHKARGGAMVLLDTSVVLGRANPPFLNNLLNDCLHFTIPYRSDKLHILLIYIHWDNERNILVKASLYKYAILIRDFNINARKRKQLNDFLYHSDFTKRDILPTFLMTNNKNSTPDLLLHTKNLTNDIYDMELTNELGSEHLAIMFKIHLHSSATLPIMAPPEINLNKTDVDKVYSHLTSFTDEKPDIDIIDIQEQTCFRYSLPKFILRLIKQKREIYRQYTQTNNEQI
ncbi:hypothetical protein ABEB36_000317 [Hypothenemus hampei]|uniref:Uncharacterized protein n=1 Tax=Hypothenemus hampei TaxID=57062 RepID=A0ABD1FDH3_HYPHA